MCTAVVHVRGEELLPSCVDISLFPGVEAAIQSAVAENFRLEDNTNFASFDAMLQKIDNKISSRNFCLI
jgi:hypothetical protein